ncbi:MAG TPA: hypothetical protein VIF09_18635, partial [Polyangiaceae bacterium]
MLPWRLGVLAVPLLFFGQVGCGSSSSGGAAAGDAGNEADPADFAVVQHSCAYSCPGVAVNCPEATSSYVCQNGGDWQSIPHADACGA